MAKRVVTMAAPRAALLLVTASLLGCGVTPTLVGARWGDDPSAVAARLGLPCTAWHRWREGRELETCSGDARTPLKALGGTADVGLVRLGHSLEGVTLSFADCSTQREALAAAVQKALGTGSGDGLDPYEIKLDGSLFHFDRSTCSLTLAGPRFGKDFSSDLLSTGLQGLFRFH
jgi:hypothetical protein